MRILFAFLLATLLLAGGHYYVWVRLVRDPALPPPWDRIARGALVGLCAAPPLAMIGFRLLSVGRTAVSWALWPIYFWMGTLLLLVTVLALADAARYLLLGLARLAGDGDRLESPERRLWLSRVLGGAVAAMTATLATLATRNALGPVAIREVEVVLPRLPRALDGFVIVQLTDLHFGPTIGRDFAEDVVRRTNALAPDLVAITGDLVDGTVAELGRAVAPLGGLRAPAGVYFVTGNHEYYVTSDGATGADAWIAELGRLGIRTLRNERVAIGTGSETFDLAGVDDWNAHGGDHGPDLGRALAGRDPAREVVLLAHQPRLVRQATQLGVGLQLSGHTHGGQIWPWMYLVKLQQPYVVGLSRQEATQLYVSPGTGYWGPPMRLGTQAEITRIVLRAPRAA